MNALSQWAPTIVTIIVAIFTAGKMTQRLDGQAKQLDDHDKLFDAHDKRLDGHGRHLATVDIALVRLEEYQKGFAAAVATQTRRFKDEKE